MQKKKIQPLETLSKSEQKYRELFEQTNDIIFILDSAGKIPSCNAAARTYGYEPQQLSGMGIDDLLDRDYLPAMLEFIRKIIDHREVHNTREFLTCTKDGEPVWVEINARIILKNGSPVSVHGIARIITDRKKMEEALRKRERELEEKYRNLEDANTALRVLLKRREEDKAELEEKVICNTRELISPYIENLKNTPMDSHQRNQLPIFEQHINEIVSPFLRTLSAKYPNLTPMETKVFTFIREGRTTKKTADMLNISARTVDVHRDNMRKKLGLKNRRANLRSHILSLTTP
ncbi:MAG: hypothetical protein CVU54_00615 [Deltaproteobacteria bacterium HGW-Deltaproteobacteria-12]|jgi:PAS domain S-box-containing protein|nr:MAG: hypothetical protein CVU54_00615 [Deltaproteobacteria bacterium HGW-Deltaproteobacteria-12]